MLRTEDAALMLAALDDLPVFPCGVNKRPVCEHGFLDATTDPEKIAHYFANPLAALVAVPTGARSGIVVLDEDPRHGSEDWARENGARLPLTRTHRTPSGGFHLFFKNVPGLRCSAGKVAPGIDIRAECGYVCWYPATGGEVVRDAPIADMPGWLVEAAMAARTTREDGAAPLAPADLAPPSAAALLDLLRAMPNPNEATRDDYLAVMLAVQGCIRGGSALGTIDDEQADAIKDAAAEWATRWDSGTASDFEAERSKWDFDWSHRTNDLTGWRHLVAVAGKLGLDTGALVAEQAAAEFAAVELPPERAAPATAEDREFWDPWQQPLPPCFPLECLPPLLRAVVEDTHARLGTDLGATAFAHIAGIAAAVDGRTCIRVRRHDDWAENPRLWIALVGEPSAKKTPLINAVLKPLRHAEQQAMDCFRMAHDLWAQQPKDERTGPEPTPPVYLLNDSTPEKTADLLSHWPRGALLHADELAGWIAGMDRYVGGSKGAGAARAFWLTAYQGGYFRQDRLGRGTIAVSNLSVSILGGIQPARLKQMKDLTDDGLLQRFIPVLMGRATLGEDRPPSPAVAQHDPHLVRLLHADPRCFRLDDAGHAIKDAAFRSFDDLASEQGIGGGFASTMGKCGALMMRLALALHFADPASLAQDSGIIPAATIERARKLMDFVVRNAAVFYSELLSGGGGGGDDTRAIASFILRWQHNEVRLRDFVRNVRCCANLDERESLRKLSILVGAGWLAPASGAYPCKAWAIAPGLRQHFAGRAKTEAARCARVVELIRTEAKARSATAEQPDAAEAA